MKILMVAAEACPFVKTGGLADVVFALSKEFKKKRQNVEIVLPLYRSVKIHKGKMTYEESFNVPVAFKQETAHLHTIEQDGIKFYFIENDHYFDREGYYGFDDDQERFAFFTLATKELILRKRMRPDIVHVHDWHVGMLPCIMKEDAYVRRTLNKTKYLITIHNMAFQGMVDPSWLTQLYHLPYELYENGQLRFKDAASTLKAGIVYSDIVTTVSPNHRYELLTPEGSMGLDGVLKYREDDFYGVVNGIDYEAFNPMTDACLTDNYSKNNFLRTKVINKRKMFEKFGIYDYGKPTYALISRVTWQKGMDVVFPICHLLASQKCNIVILGSGEKRYEDEMEHLRAMYPKNVAIYVGYNEKLAHQVYASSDYFLMPSLFEPCGLGQMIAQRYGSLPIVRETGGLKDTVIPYDGTNSDVATGYSFFNYSYEDFKNVCLRTLDDWYDLKLRNKLVKNAMSYDHSWKRSADEYLKLYRKALER